MGDAQTTVDDDNDPATPDVIVPGGGRSLGPSSVLRIGGHKLVATIGGPGPAGPGRHPAGNDITGLGTLQQFDVSKARSHGHKSKVKAKVLADLFAFETANDPDGAVSGGRRARIPIRPTSPGSRAATPSRTPAATPS